MAEMFTAAEMTALDALKSFVHVWGELMPALPDDYDCHMTCLEADTAAALFRSVGDEATAEAIIRNHAEHDEPGDLHG